ncbi:MAG: PQQ-binding-like beta-propeller repeat protein [Nitrososphaerota archaeon]
MGTKVKSGIIGVLCVLYPISLFSQHENWVYMYNGPGNGYDECVSVVYGNDGNIYGGGVHWVSSTSNWCIISLTSSGNLRWNYNFGTPEGDFFYSMVYGSDGNIYGVGALWDYPGFTILSLTNSGAYRWYYEIGVGDDNMGHYIIFGRDNNIYAAGFIDGNDWMPDFAVVSVNTGGSERWVYRHILSGSEHDSAVALAQDEEYNIYAAGKIQQKLTVISLTNTGSVRWIYQHNTSQMAYSIVYGSDGNLYVAGNNVILSLNKNTGQVIWQYLLSGNFYSIIYGSDGNLYAVSGNRIISLTNSGTYRWTYTLTGASFSKIIQAPDGHIYACGSISNDLLVTKINSANGTLIWTYTYNGPGNGSDYATSICSDMNGNIYVGGASTGTGNNLDFTIISVLDLYLGEYEDYPVKRNNPKEEIFADIESNLLKDKIFLKINAFSKENLRISIYDISGKNVFLKRLPYTSSCVISDESISKLKEGIYFLKVDSGKKEIGRFKLFKGRN